MEGDSPQHRDQLRSRAGVANTAVFEFDNKKAFAAFVDTYWKAYLAEYTTAVVIHYRK